MGWCWCKVPWYLYCLWEGWGSLEGEATKILIFVPSVDSPMCAMGTPMCNEKHENSLKFVSNAIWTTNLMALLPKIIHKTFKSWRNSYSQSMPSMPPRDCGCPLWRTMMWWSWCCPEYHPCNQWHCQESVMDLTYHLKKAAKFYIKNVVEQMMEGSIRESWATPKTRLSPMTLTESPTPLPWCRAWHCPQWPLG